MCQVPDAFGRALVLRRRLVILGMVGMASTAACARATAARAPRQLAAQPSPIDVLALPSADAIIMCRVLPRPEDTPAGATIHRYGFYIGPQRDSLDTGSGSESRTISPREILAYFAADSSLVFLSAQVFEIENGKPTVTYRVAAGVMQTGNFDAVRHTVEARRLDELEADSVGLRHYVESMTVPLTSAERVRLDTLAHWLWSHRCGRSS